MKKVLITGVAGLIGSHLLDELLKKKYRVTGIDDMSAGRIDNIRHNLDNKNFKLVKGDILDKGLFKNLKGNFDYIVHLAASKKSEEKRDVLRSLGVNTEGTQNVFEFARRRGGKVVFASTSDVYGRSKDIPFREDSDLVLGPPTAKRWAYAAAKLYSEQVAFAYNKEFGVPMTVLRYFGAFSARSSFTWSGGHVPLFIDAVLKDEEIVIHGDGKQTRSMVYALDLVKGTMLAMESPKSDGEIFNIGGDEEMSVVESARLIHKIAHTSRPLKLKFIPAKKVFGTYREIQRRVPDLKKARKILGYRPEIGFVRGLKLTIEERKACI